MRALGDHVEQCAPNFHATRDQARPTVRHGRRTRRPVAAWGATRCRWRHHGEDHGATAWCTMRCAGTA